MAVRLKSKNQKNNSLPPLVQSLENPSWILLPASAGVARPPPRPQLATLPFLELEWEDFERLCYRLAKRYGDVERWAALFGRSGQSQGGIDIFARLSNSERYSCWHSKRHHKLTQGI